MDPIYYTPIGVVRSPHTDAASTPKQTESARGITGRVELAPEFVPGLTDLVEFDYVWLLVHLHRTQEGRALWVPRDAGEQPAIGLQVVTARGEPAHGVFATRAPYRPNPIGLSLVRLVRVEGATLRTSTCWMARPCWTSNRTCRSSTTARRSGSAGSRDGCASP